MSKEKSIMFHVFFPLLVLCTAQLGLAQVIDLD